MERPAEKPVSELLQDITNTNQASVGAQRGLIRPQLVDRITFVAALVCLLLTTIAFLALIWGILDEVFALRCIGTMFVIIIAVFVFRVINAQFDDLS